MKSGLSICTTIKNRSILETEYGTKYLFKNFLLSLEKSFNFFIKNNIDVELIISDFKSDDVESLDFYIRENLKSIDYKLITLEGNFSRGKGLNISAENSKFDNLLFLDVDMKFNENLFEKIYRYTINNSYAYFPICYTFEFDPKEENGQWLDVGYGNCSVKKNEWLKSGKIPEYKQWGQEDSNFFGRLNCIKVRENCDGLIHQWHPAQVSWKNRYY